MARKEKELHMQLHPGWSARDNYATHTKKKRNSISSRRSIRITTTIISRKYVKQPPLRRINITGTSSSSRPARQRRESRTTPVGFTVFVAQIEQKSVALENCLALLSISQVRNVSLEGNNFGHPMRAFDGHDFSV
jgi:hypothetical protein